jgi:hypothetical protein
MVNMEDITDPIERMGLKCQINEFGQCPKQIFKIPHPSRDSLKPIISEDLLEDCFKDSADDKSKFKEEEGFSPFKPTSIKNMPASKLYSEKGVPKVKTVFSMGK